MNLVKVRDLVGVNIDGRLADVHARYADGTLHHLWTADEDRTRRLIEVVIDRPYKDGQEWLHLRWTPQKSGVYDCGFSGCHLDSRHADNWYILIEDILTKEA